MRPILRTLLATLVGLLTIAVTASAQSSCPECDPDGVPGVNSSYTSIDLGVITDDAEALADTDASFSDGSNETFFAWLSVCLSVFVERLEGLLGIETGVDLDANVDAYVSEHGVDLDATVTGCGETVFDLDESAAGDLDGATWEIMGDVRSATGLDVDGGVGDLVPENVDVDLCLYAEIDLAACP